MYRPYETRDIVKITTIIYVLLAVLALVLTEIADVQLVKRVESVSIDGADFTALDNFLGGLCNQVIAILLAFLLSVGMTMITIPTLIVSKQSLRRHVTDEAPIAMRPIRIRILCILGIAFLVEAVASKLTGCLALLIIDFPIFVTTLCTYNRKFYPSLPHV